MKRRAFTRNATILGATALSPLSLPSPLKPSRYKMGYQLFSIRDEMEKDPIATLKALKKMGYRDFEAYGFDPDRVAYYGFPAGELKRILDDMSLSITSGHYGFSPLLEKPEDGLRRYVDQCIKGARQLNSPYITWPWIAPEQRTLEKFKLLADKLNLIGEQVKQAGLGFAYHNHGFEFDDHDGKTGFEIILEATDPELVKLQMDMYWVMHSSSTTPAELVRAQPGRYVMWHIKDMDVLTRDYTELGNGSINYHNILPDPDTSGLEYVYIEQGGNFTHNSTQSAADSAKYFKRHLRRYL